MHNLRNILWVLGLSLFIQTPITEKQEISESNPIVITIDEGVTKKEYDHQPTVKFSVQAATYEDSMHPYYYDEKKDKEVLIPGIWKENKENMELTWRFDQDMDSAYVCIKSNTQVVAKSESFHIDSKWQSPRFTVQESQLMPQLIYRYKEEIQVHMKFDKVMDSEKSRFIWGNEIKDLTWNETKNEVTLSLNQEGQQKLGYHIFDSDGNQQVGNSEFTIQIDQSAPVLSASIDGEEGMEETKSQWNHELDVSLEVQDQSFDPKSSKFYDQDKEQVVEWLKNEDTYHGKIHLGQGNHKLTYLLKDLVGNGIKGEWKTISIDTTPPKITTSYIHPQSNQPQTIQIEIEDEHLTAEQNTIHLIYERKEQSPLISWHQEGNSLFGEFTCDQDGTYELSISSQDQMGNVVQSEPVFFTIDQMAPYIQVVMNQKAIEEEAMYMTNHKIAMDVFIQDPHLSNQSLKLYKNDVLVEEKTESGPLVIAMEKNKNNFYRLEIEASDEYQNTSKKQYLFGIKNHVEAIQINKSIIGGALSAKNWKPQIQQESATYKVVHSVVHKNHRRIDFHWGDTIEQEGTYSLELMVEDEVGNRRKLDSPFQFTIDKTPPIIALIHKDQKSQIDPVVNIHDTFYVVINPHKESTQEKDTFSYLRVNGKNIAINNQKRIPLTFDRSGTYIIEAGGIDEAGNKITKKWTLTAGEEAIQYGLSKSNSSESNVQSRSLHGRKIVSITVLCGLILGIPCLIYVRKRKN